MSVWPVTPASLSLGQLEDAQWLPLNAAVTSPNAVALMADLVPRVAAAEAASGHRSTKRRAKGTAKLEAAVGALVGGLLRRWSHEPPEAVFRSRTPADFTGGPVAVRQFLAAVDGLAGLKLVHRADAIRYLAYAWGDGTDSYAGRAPRYWPTAALLRLATQHGITPSTLAADFVDVIPTTAPTVLKPLRVFTVKQRGQQNKQPLPLSALGDQHDRIRQAVDTANEFASAHDVQGCLPPRWYRVFTECPQLGGRWQAAGREGVYQLMPKAERLARIRINGEAVAEVDVRASHLSIMHGLLGLSLPDGDPYFFPGVPRPVVKAWITAALGKGSPVTRWAPKAVQGTPALADCDPKHVARLICERYPFMRRPAEAVAATARLDGLSHIGTPARLLTHRLMGIEAEVLSGAMWYVRTVGGALALPVHDSLLVPRSAVRHARNGLDGAFGTLAKVRVRLTVEQSPEIPTG